MTKGSYKPDHKAMGQFLLSQEVSDVMYDVAKRGEQHAKSIAPVGDTGNYRESLHAERAIVPVGRKNEKRAGAVIETQIEYGGAVEAQHKVLNRTIDYLSGGGL